MRAWAAWALASAMALSCAGAAGAEEPPPTPTPASPPAEVAGTPATVDTVRLSSPPVWVMQPATAAPVDSGPKFPSPGGAMLRSAVIPGWGQAYNHSYIKAGLALAGVGFFAFKAYDEYQNELDAASAGDAAARDQYMNLKVTYIWWGAVVYLLQIADAYVDASLSTFDSDFGPGESGLGEKESPRLALSFRARF